MNLKFSQRQGLAPAAKLAQRESLDDELRSSLWSLLCILYWDTYNAPSRGMYGRSDYVKGSNLYSLMTALWLHFFKAPVDAMDEYWRECRAGLRSYFFRAEWYEIYDFIEFVALHGPPKQRGEFVELANNYLERENSAYRFVGGQIAEITSAEEVEEVEEALSLDEEYRGARTHLRTALTLLSDRDHPDFRNSIKESISAVESLSRKVSQDGGATLGVILKELERSKKLHPALRSAFSSLYGYTSDADGIRHALLDEERLTKADARFMLVCCSAFVNYVVESVNVVE